MKLKIPSKCQIAALSYEIVTNDFLLRKMGSRASANFKERKIRLPKDGVAAEQLFIELVHEVLHIVDDAAGLDIHEEDVIVRANLLSQALLSLGIEPDFSEIPEEMVTKQ